MDRSLIIVDPEEKGRAFLHHLLHKAGLEEKILISDGEKDLPDAVYIWLSSPKDNASIPGHVHENDRFIKPVRWGSLLDRIYRHMDFSAQGGIVRIGRFSLNKTENVFFDHSRDISVRVTDKEKDLLQLFARHGVQASARQNILQEVWGYAENIETHTLETHIYRLRQKLSAAGFPADLIRNTENGYRLELGED